MKPVGSNPWEQPGGAVAGGIEGRITDAVSGAGLFNANLDPLSVGTDPITGTDAPTGTDMSFGSAIRRQLATNVINGDLVLGPLDTAAVISDENVLPGWRFVGPTDGRITASWAAGVVTFTLDAVTLAGDEAYLEQIIRVAATDARAYAYQPTAYWLTAGGGLLDYKLDAQYLTDDASTTVGAAGSATNDTVQVLRVFPDADGRVPATAVYLRLRIGVVDTFGGAGGETAELTEVAADMAAVPAPDGLYGVKARRTATQTLATGVPESVHFSASDDWDSDGFHTGTSETIEIPDGADGYYMIQAGVTFAADSNGYRGVYIEYNGIDGGGTIVEGSQARTRAVVGVTTQVNVTGFYKASSGGDFFAVTATQDSGGPLDVTDATVVVIRIAGG